MKHTLIAAALAFAALTGSAHAENIIGLANTGAAVHGQVDSNYTVTSSVSSATITGSAYVATNGSFPMEYWGSNTTTSSWIMPVADQSVSLDPSADGKYTFHLGFNLTGYDAASAMFAGQFKADNSVQVILNGNTLTSGYGFTDWTAFSASSGFVAGANSLDFVVTNDMRDSGNPAGLRVEFLRSNVTAVPEPETYAMLMAGLGLVGCAARRRKQA